MNKIASIKSTLFLSFLLFASWSKGQPPSPPTTHLRVSDSIALKALVVKLLKWHEQDPGEDFPLRDPVAPDSIYTSIDWKKHQARRTQLKATGLFTKVFLSRYDSIALYLDKELKSNKEKYIGGQLPPYDHANDWCDCQDYPSHPWRSLVIKNLKTDGKNASFSWSWMKGQRYRVEAQKAGGAWRIDWLEKLSVANFQW